MKKLKRHNYVAAGVACCYLALCASALAASEISSSPLEPPETMPAAEYNMVTLRGMNKVTAKASKLESPVGTTMRFGTLDIAVHRCWQSRPEESPENAALLEILELKPGEAPTRIFLGWMFSSSPGLSGIEHPVYDITVLECSTQKEEFNTEEEKEPEKEPEETSENKPKS